MSTIGVFHKFIQLTINTDALLALYLLSLAQDKKHNLEEATRLCSETLMIEKQFIASDHPDHAKSENYMSN